MKISALRIDSAAVEGGQWVGNIPELANVRLKVRGLQNAAFRRMQARLIDAVPRAKRQGGRLDPDEQDRITATCLAATVLLDWEGLEGEDGQPLPYTKEQATEFLASADFRRFREGVLWAASQVGEEQAEADRADEGNSATASAGA